MKHTKYILICFLMAMAFASCSNDDATSADTFAKGEGALRMDVPAPQAFDEIKVVNTKSGFAIDPNQMMMMFTQQQADGTYAPYKTFDTYSNFILAGSPMVMPVGKYRVVASSFDVSKITDRVSDAPYFEGSRDFPVEEKQITNITSISCSFMSVGVEVKPSDRLLAKITAEPANYSYDITVANGTASWTFDSAAKTAPAYFLDASSELIVKVSIVLDGTAYPQRTYYVNNSATGKVSIGEYYILNIDSDTTDLTKALDVSAKCLNSASK